MELNLANGTPGRILISGGTGFIGSTLCRELLKDGHILTVISRNPTAANKQFDGKVRVVKKVSELAATDHFDAVVNLAGALVVGLPWTAKRREVLRASRMDVTRDLLAYVRTCAQLPAVWIQASAIGYYGGQAAGPVTENMPAGTGFASVLCKDWEALTLELEALQVRRVVLRFALVFGRSGGAFPMMQLPFRFCLGTVLGSGKQHVAWVHIDDVVQVLHRALDSNVMTGVYNVVAPECPTYAGFAATVGAVLRRPVFLRIPAFILRRLMGEMATILVDGPEIVPRRLLDSGYKFRFPQLRAAVEDLT